MPDRPAPRRAALPENADLGHLRGQARTLQRGVRRGDPAALRRIRAQGLAAGSGGTGAAVPLDAFPLSAAQLAVAREYGFASWPRLKHHLDTVARYRWDPAATADPEPDETSADRFCRLACLGYTPADGPDRWARAAALLADEPGLVNAHSGAAAAAADVAALRRHLAADPSAAVRHSGPYGWSPLFHLVYSRLNAPSGDAPAAARLLLEAGADPHEGYLWHGLPSPFTLLTGAFGEGEQGPERQPRHPDALALARLLLDAGADPADSQALYNRMFGSDDDHLVLLFAHGLAESDGGVWKSRLGDALATPGEMLRGQLGWAVDHRMPERVRLLAAHGVDLRTPLDGSTGSTGGTFAERAQRNGDPELVALLVAHGADAPVPTPAEALLGAALAGDGAAVTALRAAHPEAAGEARAARPSAMVWAAAQGPAQGRAQGSPQGRAEVLGLLAGLGFDVNALGRGDIPSDQPWETALHHAAMAGDVPSVRLLLSLGADRTVRDRRFDGTPLDWARHFGQEETAAVLAAEPGVTGPPPG
ncbi:ankyrin repeat domain-containing protein [Streptacidiphilus cavernicola]|uniref:Ankyrin repeat domain-containing protein n=1 Tax=Streptacidiphilus cavernicola TaxID=3342716 RepID=A0ABV6W0U0_9ACTN